MASEVNPTYLQTVLDVLSGSNVQHFKCDMFTVSFFAAPDEADEASLSTENIGFHVPDQGDEDDSEPDDFEMNRPGALHLRLMKMSGGDLPTLEVVAAKPPKKDA